MAGEHFLQVAFTSHQSPEKETDIDASTLSRRHQLSSTRACVRARTSLPESLLTIVLVWKARLVQGSRMLGPFPGMRPETPTLIAPPGSLRPDYGCSEPFLELGDHSHVAGLFQGDLV